MKRRTLPIAWDIESWIVSGFWSPRLRELSCEKLLTADLHLILSTLLPDSQPLSAS